MIWISSGLMDDQTLVVMDDLRVERIDGLRAMSRSDDHKDEIS